MFTVRTWKRGRNRYVIDTRTFYLSNYYAVYPPLCRTRLETQYRSLLAHGEICTLYCFYIASEPATFCSKIVFNYTSFTIVHK